MSEKENREWKKPEDQGNSSSFGEELDSPNRPRPADEIYTGQEYRGAGTEEKEKKKKDSIGRDISILVMITLVAGALLGLRSASGAAGQTRRGRLPCGRNFGGLCRARHVQVR